jgi:predicted glycoside hydrolase/deacetylase ChbG (UPF0249 family)
MQNFIKWILCLALIMASLLTGCQTQKPIPMETRKILIRCDDAGMNHAVNMALQEVISAGMPFSASLMVTCPWYQEAVEILRQNPQVSVGVHLTLNAEWKYYRWGPVSGRTIVASLVDSQGYFLPSRKLLYDQNPQTEEVKKEIQAQIERALGTGLKIDYLDYHMGTAVSRLEWRKLVEEFARQYGLGISRYFGEQDMPGVYAVPVTAKTDSLVSQIPDIPAGIVNLLVSHIGLDTPEMRALVDLNEGGLIDMSKHRQAEVLALTSEEFLNALNKNNIKTITYRDLIYQIGLQNMKRPAVEY